MVMSTSSSIFFNKIHCGISNIYRFSNLKQTVKAKEWEGESLNGVDIKSSNSMHYC